MHSRTTDGRTDGRMDVRTYRRTDGREDGRTDRRTNERTDRETDGQTKPGHARIWHLYNVHSITFLRVFLSACARERTRVCVGASATHTEGEDEMSAPASPNRPHTTARNHSKPSVNTHGDERRGRGGRRVGLGEHIGVERIRGWERPGGG